MPDRPKEAYPRPRSIASTTSFTTSNGEVYKRQSEALVAQSEINFRTLIDFLGFGKGGEWDTKMIADKLLDHGKYIYQALEEYCSYCQERDRSRQSEEVARLEQAKKNAALGITTSE